MSGAVQSHDEFARTIQIPSGVISSAAGTAFSGLNFENGRRFVGITPDRLPIAAFRHRITAAVRESPITIVTAEPGAGKSSCVPVYLDEEGFRVTITQPRKTAAKAVAEWVAARRGEPLGRSVGFRCSEEKVDSPERKILYCTDGLELMRELFGHAGQRDVLILDELHEWNLNMETLLAWAREQVLVSKRFKLVIMSATIQAEELAAYCGGAPIIDVPGRLFPIEQREPGNSLVEDTVNLLNEGRNVLVFEPGKREIAATIYALQELKKDAVYLPMHAGLSLAEQMLCFQSFDQPKCIVATNIAQTSLTFPDIGAVVDSGWEKRIETVNGICGLYLFPISKACRTQRMNRAGRVTDGVYIDECPVPMSERRDFPKPEIERLPVDHVALRLLKAGYRIDQMNFFHDLDRAETGRSFDRLQLLKCIDNQAQVTEIGDRVSMLPVLTRAARMITQAERLEPTVQGILPDMITIAAIFEAKGVTIKRRKTWQHLCPGETESDLIAQLMIFRAAQNMDAAQMASCGINAKALLKAASIRDNIFSRYSLIPNSSRTDLRNPKYREAIMQCILAGMADSIYQRRGPDGWSAGDDVRMLGRHSVIEGAKLVVGVPFDLEVHPGEVLPLLHMATKVDLAWIKQHAPWALAQIDASKLRSRSSRRRRTHARYCLLKTPLGRRPQQQFRGH